MYCLKDDKYRLFFNIFCLIVKIFADEEREFWQREGEGGDIAGDRHQKTLLLGLNCDNLQSLSPTVDITRCENISVGLL